ncbi:MAG: MFS transporter [Bacteroidota bacterium]
MRQERFILFLLAAVNFTNIVDSMIMMPLGDIFMTLFGINPQQFGWLVSAYSIGAFISAMVGMFFIDRFDRKRALLFIYTGFVIGTLVTPFATTYPMILAIRFGTGLFGGMIGALVLSVVSDIFPFKRRGSAMGVLMAAFSAAAALGVPLGLYLTTQFSWHAPFYFIGSVGGLILMVILIKFPSMTNHFEAVNREQGFLETITNITSDRNQVNALSTGIILILGHFIIIPFIAPYMTRNVGFSQNDITLLYFIGGSLTVFTAPMFGRMIDRLGAMRMFAILMVLSFIPVVWLTNLGVTPIPVALFVTSLFFVLGSGRMIAPQAMITASVGPKNRGSFMSVKSAMQQLAIALSAIISGAIVTFEEGTESLVGYEWVGYLSIIFSIIAILMARRLKVAKGN